ncbi:MAG: IS1380 family transposase, partial [bacterium]
DSTDDPCHGVQQLSFFNGFYDQHMYYPLLFFDGSTGELLSVRLRPGNAHGSYRMTVDLKRIVKELQRRLDTKQIIFCSDAAGAVPGVYLVAEDLGIDYLIGLPANSVLKRRVAWLVSRARQRYKRMGKVVRYYTSFWYRARSWYKRRRVLAKVEYNEKGLNLRFVVTSFSRGEAEGLFDLYEDRGESENWIKEFKNGLRADRLSCHGYVANAFRLLLHSLAYVLVSNFRADMLKRTVLASATIETIRLKLIKVGALVKETVRRIWFCLASGWPFRPIFIQVCKNLCFNTS